MLRDLNVSTSGRRVCGTPKLGVRGAAIPSTGQHGPSIIYPSLSLPADANKFYRARILTWPAQGVLRVYEDGSLDYDGTGVFEPQTFTFQLYENGVAIGGVLTGTLDTGGTYEVYGVSVTPATVSVAGAAQTTLQAAVWGTEGVSQAVTWTASAGTINSSGLFTAPAATGSVQTITVTATSVVDGSRAGSATVTVPAIAVAYTQYPNVADVRAGVRYGASGEFVGTLVVGGG
jgi:hypothetical protein